MMTKNIGRKLTALACVVTVSSAGLMTGCASMNNTERGAGIGAATGGAIGAAIGRNNGGTAKGAIIGAVLGGAAGAVIGRRMDNQARDLDRELEGAEVERVGEGIAVTFESGLLFPFDSDQLLPAGRSNLQDLARSLQSYPGTEVLIVGHTDATGSDSYNMALSQRRAESAANYLSAQGITRSRIRTQGKGEVEPVASNDSESGRQQNRRVEIAIFANAEYRQQILREYGND
jgi:outer membrane protein OmpA-like peptidoglycan-associated protein